MQLFAIFILGSKGYNVKIRTLVKLNANEGENLQLYPKDKKQTHSQEAPKL